MAEQLLTIPQAAERLNVSQATVRRHIPLILVGKACLRVDPAALEEYLRRRQSGGNEIENVAKRAPYGRTDESRKLAARLGIDLDNPRASRKRKPKK